MRILLVLLLTLFLSGCDEMFGPRNFDDCVLKNMRGVTSNLAAAQIMQSCRKKFPENAEKENKYRELKVNEMAALTGRAGLSFGNYFSGNIYNGNKEITVTQIRVEVTTKSDGKNVSHIYTANVTIPPLSTKDFGVDIVVGDKGADYSWNIDGAMGY